MRRMKSILFTLTAVALACVGGVYAQSPPSAAARTPTPHAAAAASPLRPEPWRYRRFRTAHELLPLGLPSWFREKDVNGDGQVAMAEFGHEWSDELIAEYRNWDLNGDGIITPQEALKRYGVEMSNGSSPNSNWTSGQAVAPSPPTRETSQRQRASALVRVLLVRYDSDRSGALEKAEWASLPWSDDPRLTDLDHDGTITVEELATRFQRSAAGEEAGRQ